MCDTIQGTYTTCRVHVIQKSSQRSIIIWYASETPGIPQVLRGMVNNICFFNYRTIQVSMENCPVPVYTEASIMFNWAVIFLIISIIAAFLGFGGVAGTAAEAAKVVFVVGLILFVASLVMGRLRR